MACSSDYRSPRRTAIRDTILSMWYHHTEERAALQNILAQLPQDDETALIQELYIRISGLWNLLVEIEQQLLADYGPPGTATFEIIMNILNFEFDYFHKEQQLAQDARVCERVTQLIENFSRTLDRSLTTEDVEELAYIVTIIEGPSRNLVGRY